MTMDCKEVFVALAANDFAAVVEFYHHVFEAEPTAHMPDRYAEFRLSGIKLGIFKPQPSHVDEFAQSSGAGLSLCVEVSDLDSAIAHLEHLGYQPPRRCHDSVTWARGLCVRSRRKSAHFA